MYNLNFPSDISSCEAPSDYLGPLVDKSKDVERYKDPRYPEGMISDKLYDHLCRLSSFAIQLNLDPLLEYELVRMIWVHDLPETEIGDIATTLKADGLVPAQDELSVARIMLTGDDYKLYERMKSASDYLKGEESETPDKVELIAKVLDSIDGNIYFHQHVHDWVMRGSPEFESDMDNPLKYTFKQYHKYKVRILELKDEELRDLLIGLLDYQINFINKLWCDENDLIPAAMREYIGG